MHVTDWAPTLLKAAGVDDGTIKSYGFDGVDQFKTIFDGKKPARKEVKYFNLILDYHMNCCNIDNILVCLQSLGGARRFRSRHWRCEAGSMETVELH